MSNFDKVAIVHTQSEHSGQKEDQFLILSTLDPPEKRVHFTKKFNKIYQ